MEIISMRWGYDGGGMACGPVEGNTIVELCLVNNEKLFFVDVSRTSQFEHIHISDMPLFDILVNMSSFGMDFEHEYAKVEDRTFEEYDYEIGDFPKDMEESDFAKAIQLARLAMHKYYVEGINEDDKAGEAAAFIKEYLEKDLDEMELPEIEDEDEDEDE